MEQIARKILFGLSSVGLLGGLIAFVASFEGVRLESDIFLLALILHAGVFLNYAPLAIMEHDVIRQGTLYAIYPDYARRKIRRAGYALFALFVLQFVLLLVLTRGHAIRPRNGEYVLDGQGGTSEAISQAEYARLKGYELRLFASGWVLAYFVTATYWWFPRQRYLILPTGKGVSEKQ